MRLTRRSLHIECGALYLADEMDLACPNCADVMRSIEQVLKGIALREMRLEGLVDDETPWVDWLYEDDEETKES